MIFVCLSRFISSKKSLFFNLGTLKAPLEPKLFQTAPNGLIHLNLCFGRALSQKMDLVYEFRSFFFDFLLLVVILRHFFANYTPLKVPQIFFASIWTLTPNVTFCQWIQLKNGAYLLLSFTTADFFP